MPQTHKEATGHDITFTRHGAKVVLVVKNLPAMQETQGQPLGWADPLEEGMATHCSVPAWRVPWTEEPGGYSPWGHKESDTTEAA